MGKHDTSSGTSPTVRWVYDQGKVPIGNDVVPRPGNLTTAEQAGVYAQAIMDRDRRIERLLNALTGVLSVMNVDDDGDYFICAEAEQTIANARAVVEELTQ